MFCPKCNGQMEMRDVRCPHCGYDFPSATPEREKRPILFAYSAFAYVVLAVAIIVLALTAVVMAAYGVAVVATSKFMRSDDWLEWAGGLFATLVMLIVVLRVYDMNPRK